MTAPFSGGCACGSIRYVCARAPVAMLNCHCRDCQRSSGAPFASGFIVLTSDVEITGTPVRQRRTPFVPAAVVSRLGASAPIVAPPYSRAAKLLRISCPFAFPRWTIRPSFSRCWTSGHLVRNRGFALVGKFLTILSPLSAANNRLE